MSENHTCTNVGTEEPFDLDAMLRAIEEMRRITEADPIRRALSLMGDWRPKMYIDPVRAALRPSKQPTQDAPDGSLT